MPRKRLLVAIVLLGAGCRLGSVPISAPERLRTDPNWVLVPGVKLLPQSGRSDCGAAALSTVIKYWRPATPSAQVARSLGPIDDRRGIAAGRLRDVAQAHGLKAFLVEGTVDDLAYELGQRRPVIVGLVGVKSRRSFGHYVVIVGVNTRRGLFLWADPRGAWHEVGINELLAQWRPARHLALVILP